MIWFKHKSDAMDDPFICDLEAGFEDAGYAFWFKTLELIAKHGQDGKLTISRSVVQQKMRKRWTTVAQLLDFCQTNGKLLWKEDGQKVIIECKKFAEMADNYTKYGKPSLKSLQSHLEGSSKQEEKKKRREEETEKTERATPVVPAFDFEEVWKSYPDKTGKKEAARHFKASVKTQEDFDAIKLALTNYLKSERVAKGFIQNGATWFNQWREWVVPTPAMMGRPKPTDPQVQLNADGGKVLPLSKHDLQRMKQQSNP